MSVREINAREITKAVKSLFLQANTVLPKDLSNCIYKCKNCETNPFAQSCFEDMVNNFELAEKENLPICQDTGMAVIFAQIGQDCHIVDGDLNEAVNEGVRQAYLEGRFRLSVVKDPILRGNTGDNTPAIIHTEIVKGDKITLTAAPKGFGSENMSKIKMFTPSATREDIIAFVTECVKLGGSNPCPPVVVGVGIGGDFEKCAILSKKALCRSVDIRNENEYYRSLENDMLDSINALGVGAQGFGGDITALAVNIEAFPTHIAGLPVAVNIGCHVTRHAAYEI